MVTQSTQMSGTQVLTLGTHPTQLVPPRTAAPTVKLLLTVPPLIKITQRMRKSVLASEHTSDDYSVLTKQNKLQ